MGAGEAALLVAEQDRFDQVFRHGAAVHRHERLAGAVRGAVDGARDHLFARRRFRPGSAPGSVDLAARSPRRLDHAHGRPESPIRSSNVVLPLWRRFFRRSTSRGQVAELQRVADGNEDPFGAGGLDEEVLGAGLHGLDHRLDAAGRGQHHHRLGEARGARILPGYRCPTCPASPGPAAPRRRPPPCMRRSSACWPLSACTTWKPVPLEHSLDQTPLRRIVIDDQTVFAIGDTHHFAAASDGPACLSRIETEAGEDQV